MDTSPPSASSDRLALVSSLYGPGNVACWYLITLSVILSWTLHPRKSGSGSIDANVIAVVTFFGVAAGHFLVQAQSLVSKADGIRADEATSTDYKQLVAAIEAPLTVIDAFSAPSAILACAAVRSGCFGRFTLICFQSCLRGTVLWYIGVSGFADLGLRHNPKASMSDTPIFTRFFICDFPDILPAIIMAQVVIVIMKMVTSLTLHSFKISFPAAPGSNAMGLCRLRRYGCHAISCVQVKKSERSFRSQQAKCAIKCLNVIAYGLIVLLSLAFSFTVMHLGSISHHNVESAQTTLQVLTFYMVRMGRSLFPQTTCSITDLDQAVSLASGATVLGFCIFDIAKSYYEIRRAGETRSQHTTPPSEYTRSEREEDIELQPGSQY